MKKVSRAVFLVAAALCAVVIGRAVNRSFRSGLPDAVVGVSHAHAAVPSANSEVFGLVTRVSDGDTIWVQDAKGLRHKIRMLDIDAPESTQTFGGESTARLKSLIGGKTVKVTYSETDKYGRLLGTVWLGGEDVNLKMVAEGMAWCYHYSKNERYAAAQSAASPDRRRRARKAHKCRAGTFQTAASSTGRATARYRRGRQHPCATSGPTPGGGSPPTR